MLDFNKLVL